MSAFPPPLVARNAYAAAKRRKSTTPSELHATLSMLAASNAAASIERDVERYGRLLPEHADALVRLVIRNSGEVDQ